MPIFHTRDFELSNGARLAALEVAYVMYGAPTSNFDNVILATHGITSTHLGGDEPTLDRRRGWWHEIIGSGKLFDTDRYCVVASNILGSCYGTTGPASIDPATGEPYGADFPELIRQSATYVERVLWHGAKPANLPIQLPARFELVVSPRMAKAIGMPLPRSVVMRADRVIE